MEAKFSREQAQQLLGSPEGQQLLSLLARGGNLQKAAEAFQKGNVEEARKALQPALQTEEAGRLLHKLSGGRE